MDDLEFAFGPFRTYQMPLRQIENLTGLDFGELKVPGPLRGRLNVYFGGRLETPGTPLKRPDRAVPPRRAATPG